MSSLFQKPHLGFTLLILVFFTIPPYIVKSVSCAKQFLYKQFNILSGKVNVQASLFANEGWDVNEGPYDFEILVTYDRKQFKVPSLIIGVRNIDKAVFQIIESTGWKDHYLFVPSECGGGNAWRCNIEHIFTIREGKLIRVGEARSDDGKPGSSYRNGFFYDIYDGLEVNRLTSHAESPAIEIIMEEKGGRIIVDLERTWEKNLNQYKQNLVEMREPKNEKYDKQTMQRLVIKAVLFNAALAKYCRHQKELKEAMEEAKSRLEKEDFELLKVILSKLNPGELPKYKYVRP